MTEEAIRLFRAEYRAFVLERLLFRVAFHAVAPPQHPESRSAADGRRHIREWIRQEGEIADQVMGQRFRGDAALTALYADEAKDVLDSLIDLFMSLPDPS